MERTDALALLLAGRHTPELRDVADFQKAEALLESDAALRAEFEAERAYYDEHQDLLAGVRLSDAAKVQIKSVLADARAGLGVESALPAGKVIAFPGSRLKFAVAACLALFLGLSIVKLSTNPPTDNVVAAGVVDVEALRDFAASTVLAGFSLDHKSTSVPELVDWLAGQDVVVANAVDPQFEALDGMGCKTFDWQGGKVALICFKTPQDEVVHLFMADRAAFGLGGDDTLLERKSILSRETLSWMTPGHAYVLVAHDKGQSLDGFSG